jgi:trigger factor
MKVQVEAISPVEKKLTVEIDPERVVKELDHAYVGLGRRVKLRGFRQGKVPRQVLERHFRDEVEKDVLESLVSSTFGEAIREQNLPVVAPPKVSVDEPGLGAGKPLKYTARVEVKPQVQPKDYKGLEVARKPAEVTDQMISDELTRLQEGMSQLVPVEGRFEAQEGDYALIDHEGNIAGAPFEGSKAQGVTVRVQPGEFHEGNVGALAGKKLGESVEVEYAFPADYRSQALRGKVARFQITLQGIKVRKVPALDDEMAKDVGIEGVDTLDKLRARMRQDIEKREQRRAEAELRDGLLKEALKKNDFDVPSSLVERAIDSMLEGASQRFARQGLDMRQMGLDVSRLRADLREQALTQVKGALLLEAIAEVEKIEVTPEDLQAEIAKLADELQMPLAKVQQQMRGEEQKSALKNRIREDKTIVFLTTNARLS